MSERQTYLEMSLSQEINTLKQLMMSFITPRLHLFLYDSIDPTVEHKWIQVPGLLCLHFDVYYNNSHLVGLYYDSNDFESQCTEDFEALKSQAIMLINHEFQSQMRNRPL